MNIFTKSVSLAAILIVAGCTGCSSFPQLPPTEKVSAQIENYQLPQTPSEGKALVYIVRPSFVFGLVPFGVYVDGKDDLSRVGHNRTRQYIHFELEPGEGRLGVWFSLTDKNYIFHILGYIKESHDRPLQPDWWP